MTHENPYRAPESAVSAKAFVAPKRWNMMLLLTIALQLLVTAIYATTLISQLRRGEISPLTGVTAASASAFLAIGGVLQLLNSRFALHVFFLSTVLGALAYLHWRPPFVLTGLLISACAWVLSLVTRRITAKA